MARRPAGLSPHLVRLRVPLLLALGHEVAALPPVWLYRARDPHGSTRRGAQKHRLAARAGAGLLSRADRLALRPHLRQGPRARPVLCRGARLVAGVLRHRLFRLPRPPAAPCPLPVAGAPHAAPPPARHLRLRQRRLALHAGGADPGIRAAIGDQGSGAHRARAQDAGGDVGSQCTELQRLSRRADAEPRPAAGRRPGDEERSPARPARQPALRFAVLQARHRARENPLLRRWLVPAIAGAAFIIVWALDANRALFIALNALGPATSDWLWANVTVLGDTVVAFALCLPLWRRRPDLLWAFVFLALLGTLWVHGLKHSVDVSRPPAVLPDVHIVGPGYKAGSFPSGHATTVFAVAGLLAIGARSRTTYVLLVTGASIAALSRAVVGVHWPLDILAGAFGGWLSAALALELARRTHRLGSRTWVQWALGIFLALCAAWLVIGHPRSGYPQADLFQRAIGICCLAAAAARLKRAAA